MRVLHVLRRDHNAHTGGDLIQLRALVEALQALGVDAFASSSVGDVARPPDVVHLYNLDRTAEVARTIAAARERWPRCRIVISPVFWPAPLGDVVTAYRWPVRGRAVKYVLKEVRWWRAQRAILASADAICPSSEGEGARISSWFRMPRDRRWLTVPNGIWLARWPFRDGPADRRTALAELDLDPGLDRLVACAARVEARKNQLALVEAIRRLPNTGLALIGPVSEVRYGRAVDAAAGAAGRVALTGECSQLVLARLLRSVDVHVLPSLQEIPGLATLEAAAIGCEVVYTPGGSTGEYVGDLGHQARSGRPRDLAAAIEFASHHPKQPALRRRVERFDWSDAARALMDAYEVALAPEPFQPRRRW